MGWLDSLKDAGKDAVIAAGAAAAIAGAAGSAEPVSIADSVAKDNLTSSAGVHRDAQADDATAAINEATREAGETSKGSSK